MKVKNQFVRNDVRRWAALLFVLVIAVFGYAQAVHIHPGLSDEDQPNATSTHCMLCVASHSAAVTAEFNFAPAPVDRPETILIADPQIENRLEVFSSFIRPPPAC